MLRHVGFSFLALALLACASPSGQGTGTKPATSNGPGVDLGGFISQESADLSSAASFDFAIAPVSDMAHADLAQASSADMAQTGTACGAITFAGQCTSNTLKYCSASSQLTTVDCAAGGRQCTVVAGDADCRYVAGSPCGTITYDGVCDGDTVVYCSNNKITLLDCAGLGSSCLSFLGSADCL